jgi:hypothetical protein
MPLIETLTVNLAAALLKTTAKLWFKDKPFAEGAAGAFVDSFKKYLENNIGDFATRRATQHLFEGLQDEVARRLEQLVEVEFPRLPENERTAAVLAVADTFDRHTIPESLFAADLDAAQLESAVRPASEGVFSTLSTDTRALAAMLLRESCNYVVTLAGRLPNFQVAATREILKRHSELLADLGRVLDALSAMRTDPRLDRASEARDFELQYRRALDRRLDRLELFGVRLVGGGARAYPLTVAYVSLTATASRGDVPVRVEDALAEARRIVIRGEAGSGKTTLLRWLAVRAANRDFPGALAAWNERLPIYLALRDYTIESLPRPERFLDHIAANLIDEMPRGWCQDVLRTRALLLIDGIDELPAARRKNFATWLEELLTDFGDMVVIASARPAALDAEKPVKLGGLLANLGFVNSALQPMSLSNSETLVSQWHAAVARDLADEADRQQLEAYERDLRQMLHDRAAIRHLASTPLLCAMICALNWDRQRRVPDDRMELYRLALEMLLEARDVDRGVEAAHVDGLDRQAKEELLDTIAYWMMRNGLKESDRETVEERVEEALRRLGRVQANQNDVLQELVERSGVLNEPQHGVVSWVHRTFLEFMGARAAIAAGDIRLLADQAKQESWREAVVFAAGHARGKARDQLVRELLKKRWLTSRPLEAEVTAACCLETVGNSLEPGLLDELKGLARRLFPPQNTATAQLLAPAAALEPGLLEGHAQAGPAAVAACIRAAAVVGGARMLDVIASYAEIQGNEVDVEMARAWQAFDGQAFVDKVIKRRPSFLGLSTDDLDQEQLHCLQLLIELGQVPPPYNEAKERLVQFRQQHYLRLTDTDQSQIETYQVKEVNWFLYRRVEYVVERVAPTKRRLSTGDIRRIAALRSLERLALPDLDPDAVPMLGDLTSLKRLSFAVNRPCDLQWLPRLASLEEITLAGNGVRDLRVLAQCPALVAIHLQRCSTSSLEELPLGPQLKSLEVSYLPLDSLDGIERASGLERLKLEGLAVRSPEWLPPLQHLRSLDITYPKSTMFVPYEQLALEKIWLQGTERTALSGLEQASKLRTVVLSSIDQKGVLVVSLPASTEEFTVFNQAELDLAPLAAAPRLRHLHLQDIRCIRNADTLLGLSNLSYFSVQKCVMDTALTNVIKAFGDREVHLDVSD